MKEINLEKNSKIRQNVNLEEDDIKNYSIQTGGSCALYTTTFYILLKMNHEMEYKEVFKYFKLQSFNSFKSIIQNKYFVIYLIELYHKILSNYQDEKNKNI